MNRRLALCAAPIVLLIALRIWNRVARAEERHGRFTAAQVLDRAEALDGQLVTSDSAVRLAADAVSVPRPNRPPKRYWHVECTDPAGREVSFLRWDAETGHVISMSCLCDPPAPDPVRLVDAQSAIVSSSSVLETLGPYIATGPWRLAGLAEHSLHAWHVTWRSMDQEAIITLGMAGELRSVEFLPCSRSAHVPEGNRPGE